EIADGDQNGALSRQEFDKHHAAVVAAVLGKAAPRRRPGGRALLLRTQAQARLMPLSPKDGDSRDWSRGTCCCSLWEWPGSCAGAREDDACARPVLRRFLRFALA